MKLIIAGSRTFDFYRNAKSKAISTYYIDCFLESTGVRSNLFTEVVCGCGSTDASKVEKLVEDGYIVSSSGIDQLGEYWAYENQKTLKFFPGKWKELGRSAGPIRNKEMAQYGDILLLIWDGKSRGSANMKMQMEKLNKPVIKIILKQPTTFNILFGKDET